MSQPHRIVFANEKGGTGKSTTAVHIAIALSYLGARVAAIDLDPRQRTLHRYLENRAETIKRRDLGLPNARFEVFNGTTIDELDALVREVSPECDYLIFDTPGRDDEFARYVATDADTLVTPLNDSFVDFDLIGQVDAETFKVRRLSFYAELIWEARFRIAQGLSERVIYRELFPSGLTLLDKGHLGDLGTSHLVARQELRKLVSGLNLPAPKVQRAQLAAAPVEG
jgi:chromosome partitioning protein